MQNYYFSGFSKSLSQTSPPTLPSLQRFIIVPFYYCSGGNTRTVATPKMTKRARLPFFFSFLILLLLVRSSCSIFLASSFLASLHFCISPSAKTTIMTAKKRIGLWGRQKSLGFFRGDFLINILHSLTVRAQIKYGRPLPLSSSLFI